MYIFTLSSDILPIYDLQYKYVRIYVCLYKKLVTFMNKLFIMYLLKMK